jgi:hypothetical protein
MWTLVKKVSLRKVQYKSTAPSFIGWPSKISFLTKNLGVFQMTKVEKMAKNGYMKLGIQPISIIFPGGKN